MCGRSDPNGAYMYIYALPFKAMPPLALSPAFFLPTPSTPNHRPPINPTCSTQPPSPTAQEPTPTGGKSQPWRRRRRHGEPRCCCCLSCSSPPSPTRRGSRRRWRGRREATRSSGAIAERCAARARSICAQCHAALCARSISLLAPPTHGVRDGCC